MKWVLLLMKPEVWWGWRDLPRAVEPACCTTTSLSSFRFVWIIILGCLHLQNTDNFVPVKLSLSLIHFSPVTLLVLALCSKGIRSCWMETRQRRNRLCLVNSSPTVRWTQSLYWSNLVELTWFWITQNDSRILLHIWTLLGNHTWNYLIVGNLELLEMNQGTYFWLTHSCYIQILTESGSREIFSMFPEKIKINCQR